MNRITLYVILIFFFATSCTEKRHPVLNSGIEDFSYSDVDVNNLYIVCKQWGEEKYSNPKILKGEIDWDSELFKLISKVISTKEIVKNNHREYSSSDFDFHMNEYSFLNVNEILERDNRYSGLSGFPDVGFRLLTLFRYWNIIEYFYPYKHLIGEPWDDVLKRFIPQFIDAKNELEYKFLILELITCFNDGHAMIDDSCITDYFGDRYLPVDMAFVDGKAVVVGKNTNYCFLDVGDIILSIQGEEVDSIVAKRTKYTPASNYAAKLQKIANGLLQTGDYEIKVEFDRAGSIYSETLQTGLMQIMEITTIKPMRFIQVQDSIYYLNLVGQFYGQRLYPPDGAKGIIIDLRGYPNTDDIDCLNLNFLFPENTHFASYMVPMSPGIFTRRDDISVGVTGNCNGECYNGKTIILINSCTQSMSEFLAMRYRCSPNALLLGGNTSGADGDILILFLPGDITTTISGIGIIYPNGEETQRVGLCPDIRVYPTISDIRKGKDKLLNAAINVINNEDPESITNPIKLLEYQ